MATVRVEGDEAVIATFTASDGDADHVRMGSLTGNAAVAQIAVTAETVEGSNDGTNWDVVATAPTGTFQVVTISPVPLYLRSPAANTGGIVIVGWRNK